MLSKTTVKLLNEACEKSDYLYDQGGLIYLYKFGHNRAHSFYDYDFLKNISGERSLNEHENKQLILFFASALENHNADHYGELTTSTTNNILSSLLKDFKGMYGYINNYEDDGVSKILTISFIEGNDFHSLELFWSID